MEKRIVIIAGPNGAGKTTFARDFLPQEAHCPDFINADLIAAGLSPFRPEAMALRAGRLMLEESGLPCEADFPFTAECRYGGDEGSGKGGTGWARRAVGSHPAAFRGRLAEFSRAVPATGRCLESVRQ